MLRFRARRVSLSSLEPLRWVTYFGLGAFLVSLALGCGPFTSSSRTARRCEWLDSLMGVVLSSAGLQLVSAGRDRRYLGRFFDEVRLRPLTSSAGRKESTLSRRWLFAPPVLARAGRF